MCVVTSAERPNINLTGWIGLFVVLAVHFASVTWYLRGVVDLVERNKEKIEDNAVLAQREIERTNKTLDEVRRDVKTLLRR